MNHLNEDQVNLIKQSKNKYGRMLLTRWRFLLVPLMMAWYFLAFVVTVALGPFAAICIALCVSAFVTFRGAPKVFWSAVEGRAKDLRAIWRIWDKLLVGEEK